MRREDPSTGKPRGWLALRARTRGLAVGFSVKCHGESWRGLVDRLGRAIRDLASSGDIDAAVSAMVPLAEHLEVRAPSATVHRDAVDRARRELRDLPLHARIAKVVGAERAEVVIVLLLASQNLLPPEQRARVGDMIGAVAAESALGVELENVRAQLDALWAHMRDVTNESPPP
jgi:hypothetical protein